MSRLFVVVAAWLAVAGGLHAADDRTAHHQFTEDAIAERIQPFGTLCVAGEDCASGQTTGGVAMAGASQSPEQIYQTSCFSCHGTGAAGAPKLGDAAAWAPRLEKGMDTLVMNAVNGINAMPPKGLCMSCSEEDIRATVEYMVNQSE